MPVNESVVPDLDKHFPRYEQFHPAVPVWCVTPNEGRAFHRFFDTSPISPSGRYLAFTRMPFEDRRPEPGEEAEICVTDLATGEETVVARTAGWEPQMGANLNWGADDHALIFNDVDTKTWQPFAWKLDPASGEKMKLQGTVYHVSPDGKWACASNPVTMPRTQYGYGVIIPPDRVPRFEGARDDEGLWLTDLDTGERKLLLSIKDAIERATPTFELDDPDQYEIYGFHSKFNPQGDRLIFTLRFFKSDNTAKWNMNSTRDLRFTVLTLDLEANRVCNAVPTSKWLYGGHHINWHPNGRELSMNLKLEDGGPLWFVGCDETGDNLRQLREDILGSGHPSIHPDGKHLLTDTYTSESTAFGDGTIPLRWVDLEEGSVRNLVRINTRQTLCKDGTLRIDPHPAWDRSWRYVTFNGFVGGTRRVFVADMQSML